MKRTILAIALVVLIAVSNLALAHSGRTDAYGGHWDRKNGSYHYHNTGSSEKQPASQKSSKKSAKAPDFTEEGVFLYGITRYEEVYVFDSPWLESDWNTMFPDEGTLVEIIGVAMDAYGEVWYHLSPSSAGGYVYEDDLDVYEVDEYFRYY